MNTGIKPFCIIGAIVVGKPAATVITSSPFLSLFSFNFGDVRAVRAIRFADEPEFTVKAYFIFKNSDSFFRIRR